LRSGTQGRSRLGPGHGQRPGGHRGKPQPAADYLTTAPDVASPNSKLAKILTYHVVGKRYDAASIVQAGTLDSLEGAKIKIGGTSAAPTVNGATVLCGNIPTKNATVFVIGQVLSLPAS
jgi:uncharacterized surface protein with fasciclin (FAS1) repeats